MCVFSCCCVQLFSLFVVVCSSIVKKEAFVQTMGKCKSTYAASHQWCRLLGPHPSTGTVDLDRFDVGLGRQFLRLDEPLVIVAAGHWLVRFETAMITAIRIGILIGFSKLWVTYVITLLNRWNSGFVNDSKPSMTTTDLRWSSPSTGLVPGWKTTYLA